MNLDRLCELLDEMNHEINNLRTYLLHSRDNIGREIDGGACSAPQQGPTTVVSSAYMNGELISEHPLTLDAVCRYTPELRLLDQKRAYERLGEFLTRPNLLIRNPE